jgi:hypothetical protein
VASCYDPDLGTEQTVVDYSTFTANRFGRKLRTGERTKLKFNLCLPSDPYLRSKVEQIVGIDSFPSLLVRAIKSFIFDYEIVIFTGAWIVVLGYFFLFLMEHPASAKCLVHVSITGQIVIPLFLAFQIVKDSLMDWVHYAGRHDAMWMATAAALGLVSFAYMCAACILCGGLDMAIGCVEAAAECLFDESSLLLEPIVGMLPKVCVCIVSAFLLLIYLSQAAVSRPEQPLTCGFDFTGEWIAATSFSLFLICWLLTLLHHMSQYVLADVAQAWYYKKKRRHFGRGAGEASDDENESSTGGICRPYYNLLRYHMGSVAKGSFLSLLFRPFRVFIGLLHSIETEDQPCARCISLCCVPCLWWFEEYLQYFCKDAYMDMALGRPPPGESSDFMPSARRARDIQKEEKATTKQLHSAGSLFFFSSMGLFVLSTAGVTYLCCKIPNFPVQVTDWKPVVFYSAVMSVLIGTNFLVILDTIGDTLFFILAAERRNWKENHQGGRFDQMRQKLEQERERSGLLSSLNCLWRSWEDHEEKRMDQGVYRPEKLATVMKMMESQSK